MNISVVCRIMSGGVLAAAVVASGTSRCAERGEHQIRTLRAAIADLTSTFGSAYPRGAEFLARLERLHGEESGAVGRASALADLKREALLANPLLDGAAILVVRRRPHRGGDIGLPANGSSNSGIRNVAFDNDIAVLLPALPGGGLTTLHRPVNGGYAGEVDLHWEGDRFLFSESDRRSFSVWEMRVDGSGLRRVSQTDDDVDCYDACYLPDGRIVFSCTAPYQSVPCFHGIMPACQLYIMNADGSGMRQLCFDQDLDLHPTVLESGQVMFNRWDYTGINHIYMRQLMVMNPDGSGQRAIHGSNSWFPNALYYSRAIPGCPTLLVSILAGYHVPRTGRLVILDVSEGWHGADGIQCRISGRGAGLEPAVRDRLTANEWPQFAHPFPLTDRRWPEASGRYVLVACQPERGSLWGIYLADIHDNLVLVHQEAGMALLEPIPVRRRPMPPAIPDRVDLGRRQGTVYLHDVYAGPGLAGVPSGSVRSLRVFAYHFGYRGLAGPDKVGRGGPWEVMRILGTVPVAEDGSAAFHVPACTPLAVQPLDHRGQALQLMRSWFTLMPGETLSCVGCHETPAQAVPRHTATAAGARPVSIRPWYGPARGFDFEREVQPVLDHCCVRCHDGRRGTIPDLRRESAGAPCRGWPVGFADRLHPDMKAAGWQARYTPAYDVLVRHIRRVGIEDDVTMLLPGEYHVDTSPLVQMLRNGHHGVRLSIEAWDRLVTWIDLNAPCHGTWGEVFSPIPDGAHERRMALRARYGGPRDDPEYIPATEVHLSPCPPVPETPGAAAETGADGRCSSPDAARSRPQHPGCLRAVLQLPGGVSMRFVNVPPGTFTMGAGMRSGDADRAQEVEIEAPFWISVCEVSNAQYRVFDPLHDSHYDIKRYAREDGQGMPLDGDEQPVVRVSWHRAREYCQWLTERTGAVFALPTEAQWEYACRAGSGTSWAHGVDRARLAAYANTADIRFSRGYIEGDRQLTGGLPHMFLQGADLADTSLDDGAVVTAPIGRYRANAWGLHDMHGNAAEWTSSYAGAGAYAGPESAPCMVVKGGSYADPPRRCCCAHRISYPPWRRVFNVGFRVICLAPEVPAALRD